MSIVLKHISYIHPDKEPLFNNLNLVINAKEKSSLVGKNGSGKSTLLKIISGQLIRTEGEIITSSEPYYIPQHFGQYDKLTIAGALGIQDKLNAMYHILQGDTDTAWFDLLNDDWTIEERISEALRFWEMEAFTSDTPLKELSGGEKTSIFLAGILIHQPDIILMDEPTNHLDLTRREKLYDFIRTTSATLLVVSHDITLLNLLDHTLELEKNRIISYGGNYDFYKEEKELQKKALLESLEDKEKELRIASKMARETAERKNKLDARGKKHSEKKGISRMGINTLRDKAEKSTTRLKEIHQNKIDDLKVSVKEMYKELPDNKQVKIIFNSSTLHEDKILIKADTINFGYGESMLWKENKSFEIRSGERILIKGRNGSGKTTLLKLLSGRLTPSCGEVHIGEDEFIYIDQEYSIIDNRLTVLEQLEEFNHNHLPEHDLRMLLARLLFPYTTWNKPCKILSGGEKVRLLFCCLLTGNNTPDMIILDEPTNNIDIESMNIILSAIEEYKGTILLVSHDQHFIERTKIERIIEL